MRYYLNNTTNTLVSGDGGSDASGDDGDGSGKCRVVVLKVVIVMVAVVGSIVGGDANVGGGDGYGGGGSSLGKRGGVGRVGVRVRVNPIPYLNNTTYTYSTLYQNCYIIYYRGQYIKIGTTSTSVFETP